MPNSVLMEFKAGDIIEDEMGETSVKHDTMRVAAHLRFNDPNTVSTTVLQCTSDAARTILGILRIVI